MHITDQQSTVTLLRSRITSTRLCQWCQPWCLLCLLHRMNQCQKHQQRWLHPAEVWEAVGSAGGTPGSSRCPWRTDAPSALWHYSASKVDNKKLSYTNRNKIPLNIHAHVTRLWKIHWKSLTDHNVHTRCPGNPVVWVPLGEADLTWVTSSPLTWTRGTQCSNKQTSTASIFLRKRRAKYSRHSCKHAHTACLLCSKTIYLFTLYLLATRQNK